MTPETDHGFRETIERIHGHSAHCWCGYSTMSYRSAEDARKQLDFYHIAPVETARKRKAELEGGMGAAYRGDITTTPIIYCFIDRGPRGKDVRGDRVVIAITAAGEQLAAHCSSDEWFAQHDIGLTSSWKHDRYMERFPDGYEMVWLDKPEEAPELAHLYAPKQEATS